MDQTGKLPDHLLESVVGGAGRGGGGGNNSAAPSTSASYKSPMQKKLEELQQHLQENPANAPGTGQSQSANGGQSPGN